MQVLNLINKKRKQLGAHPVELDEKLNELAQIHSDDMAKNMYSGHENREGKNGLRGSWNAFVKFQFQELVKIQEGERLIPAASLSFIGRKMSRYFFFFFFRGRAKNGKKIARHDRNGTFSCLQRSRFPLSSIARTDERWNAECANKWQCLRKGLFFLLRFSVGKSMSSCTSELNHFGLPACNVLALQRQLGHYSPFCSSAFLENADRWF